MKMADRDAVIDVGGAASVLTGALLDRSFDDLTVLDISAAWMQHARQRLGPGADRVHWLTADILSWHDRAVYHFLTTEEHRASTVAFDPARSPDVCCFALGRKILRRVGFLRPDQANLSAGQGPLPDSAAGIPSRLIRWRRF